jgi:glycosyltransferase involved in cell wall biosynthesis
MNPTSAGATGPGSRDPAKRALVVSSACAEGGMANQMGREAYSYRFVYQIFAPLLRRWGRVVEVGRPESRLDYALWRLRREGLDPVHLSFHPLHMTYLTAHAPNIAVPAWEFPDIPSVSIQNNPRNNWVRIAEHLDVIVTHCQIGRKAFERANVKTPVHVVPVPIPPEYFAVPAWDYGERCALECPCYVFPQPEASAAGASPWEPMRPAGLSLRARGRELYKSCVKPRLPESFDRYLTLAARAVGAARRHHERQARVPYPVSPTLELSGVVYTTIFNPHDPRKNWQDMLSAYLSALGDCEDATLVMKLVIPPELAVPGLNGILDYYRRLGVRHRAKLAFVTGYLSDEQMLELARGTTYYLNASRAEGSCLPLQNSLAAGRPGLAPAHSGMSDYFEEQVGFVIAAHPEPASWPHDPDQRLTTRWHRIVWQSLHDQLRVSYDLARRDGARYRALAERGRQRAAEYASVESVWPLLIAALNAAARAEGRWQTRPPAGGAAA